MTLRKSLTGCLSLIDRSISCDWCSLLHCPSKQFMHDLQSLLENGLDFQNEKQSEFLVKMVENVHLHQEGNCSIQQLSVSRPALL